MYSLEASWLVSRSISEPLQASLPLPFRLGQAPGNALARLDGALFLFATLQ
jgi:hypothetical protein